jgi:hypothetical protein
MRAEEANRLERLGGDLVAGDAARDVEQDAVHLLGGAAGLERRPLSAPQHVVRGCRRASPSGAVASSEPSLKPMRSVPASSR